MADGRRGNGLRRVAAAVLAAAGLASGPLPARTAVSELPGLVAYWKADGSGADSAGTNTGVLEGGTSYAAGHRGQAFLLDGIDDAVAIPDAPALNPTTGVTVAAWLHIDDTSSSQKPIVVKSYTAASQPHYSYALAWYAPQNSIGFYLGIGGSYQYLAAADLDILGRWAHVAGTYDGSQMRIYVDGQLAASLPVTGTIQVFATDLHIGRYRNNAGCLQGLVDEVALFDRGLTQAEIQGLFAPTPLPPTDLFAVAASGRRIDLDWTDASDDETGFEIERDGGSGFGPLASPAAGSTSWEDGTVLSGTAYAYRVRAVNGAGASAWSATAQATTPPAPAAPTGLSAAASRPDRVDISWDGVPAAATFEIQRGPAPSGPFADLDTVPAAAGTVSYFDLSVAAGTAYAYRVRAVNPDGDSPFAGPVAVTTPQAFEFLLLEGELVHSTGREKDRLDARGTMGSEAGPWDGFDPEQEGLRFVMAAGPEIADVVIPAGDAGWHGRGSRLRWTSPKEARPRVEVTLDARKSRWSVRIDRAEFPVPSPEGVTLSLRAGERFGESVEDWAEARNGGRLRFRAP